MIEVLASVLLIAGSVIVLIASIGIIKLPDFYCRLHAAGVIDTMGSWLVLGGLLLLSGNLVNGFKVAIIGVLLFFIAPVVSHAIARAAIEYDADKAEGKDG
jgi:multicomponent Na+:H+ antiporter subunit G